MNWYTAKGVAYPVAKPHRLRIPSHTDRAYDLGTPTAWWATRLQQACYSMSLLYTPGDPASKQLDILEAANN